jgi:hypothetical protein
MSKSQTISWKVSRHPNITDRGCELNRCEQVFFHIKELGLFTGSTIDHVALVFLYLPTIREETYHYVDLWNIHRIRKQEDRPYLPYGKPVVLYLHHSFGRCN